MNSNYLSEKPCRYYKKYKAIFKPKCKCKPCHDKWELKWIMNEETEDVGILDDYHNTPYAGRL